MISDDNDGYDLISDDHDGNITLWVIIMDHDGYGLISDDGHDLIRDGSDEACGCAAYCTGPKEYRLINHVVHHDYDDSYDDGDDTGDDAEDIRCSSNYCLQWEGERGPRCDGKRQVGKLSLLSLP